MDGWVIIGTKLETKQLDKNIKDAKKELEKYEKDAEKLTSQKAELEIEIKGFEESRKEWEKISDQARQVQKEIENIDTSTEQGLAKYRELHDEFTRLNDVASEYRQIVEGGQTAYDGNIGKVKEIGSQLEENASKQLELNDRINELSAKKTKVQFLNDMKDQTEDIGKQIKDAIKTVAKWGLALISVRSAYLGIRKAISMVTSENEGINKQFEVMKSTIANALAPLVQQIVDLFAKLMIYVNYVFKALTGKDLFNFEKAFENASKSASDTASSAKEINKQLAGFDEMNVLSDTSTSGAGGGATANIEPIKNPFEGWQDMEMPKWLNDIIWWAEWILANWEQVVGQLLLIKLVIDLLTGNWVAVIIDIIGFVILGLIEIGKAIGDLIKSGKQLLEPVWQWVADNIIAPIVEGFNAFIDGIINTFNMVVKYINDNVVKPVSKFFTDLWDGIKKSFANAIKFIEDTFNNVVKFFKNIIDTIVTLFKNIGTKVGDAISGAFKTVINGVLKAVESILNFPIKSINKLIDTINKVPGINLGLLPTFTFPRLAKGGIVSMPGRGVLVGGAITGEDGMGSREGVIPLTNSQQMELLGEAIGKYITINANITNTMNGRVISRELQRVQNNSDFAFNK